VGCLDDLDGRQCFLFLGLQLILVLA
jgi:hypothetical protein